MKAIIGKLALEYPNRWEQYLPTVLWALREAVNATTGLSPWTLVFGRVPRGPLTILKNHWIGTEKLPVSFGKTAVQYLREVQQKLEVAAKYASSHAEVEQERYKKYHNLRSADKRFEVGEKVLVLIPDSTASKLFSKWKGPATVVAIRSPYSYEIDLDGTIRHFHANQLRKYHVRVESVLYDSSVYQFVDDEEVTLMNDNDECLKANACAVVYESDVEFGELCAIPTSLTNPNCHDLPSSKMNPDAIKHLTKAQQSELLKLLDCFPQCFSDVPGFSDVISHTITLKEGFKPKRMSAYRVPEKLKADVDKQIQEMLDQKIIHPSLSPMASPLAKAI